MSVDFASAKAKIEDKLPEMLPKAVKWIIVHLLMLLCHFRMPIWVTALKASKTVKNIKADKQGGEEATAVVSESAPSRHEKLRARRDARRVRRNEMRFNSR